MKFAETDTNSDHYRPVLVVWVDSTSDEGAWRTLNEMLVDAKGEQDPTGEFNLQVRTIGYLLHEDDRVVAVAQSVTRFRGHSMMAIPRGCIRRIEFLA